MLLEHVYNDYSSIPTHQWCFLGFPARSGSVRDTLQQDTKKVPPTMFYLARIRLIGGSCQWFRVLRKCLGAQEILAQIYQGFLKKSASERGNIFGVFRSLTKRAGKYSSREKRWFASLLSTVNGMPLQP